MLPNIDLRIANMIKALEQVILPALPREQRQARDQAMLVAGHLRMMGDQWKSALLYEQVSLDDLAGLARELLSDAPASVASRLENALAAAQACDRVSITALEQANIDLGNAVDAFILGGDDHAPLSQAVTDAVLAYGLRHARRERTWFKANRLDPDRDDLPAIEEIFAGAD
ncbi:MULTISPECIES: hypothetical protein [Sphingobium]|jgi:hypothetical protein|uniref:Uncharacterized protein n=1 Tax=Sphingobium lactosutens DS20 TaxID=1331060 RepID=T0IM93_9SPHN|nr:hypothetical protein [Sphingobium lactosutens]EQB10754.1 hypothetical protein RLDS_25300 [Sphingobium lactosutens DS20]